jgi:Acyl-CoA dehydrogenases
MRLEQSLLLSEPMAAGLLTVRRTSLRMRYTADTCVAMAVTDRSQRSKGISAFIFEKGMNGFSPSKKENKLGLRASETASVVFEDCFVPDGNLLGEEGRAL